MSKVIKGIGDGIEDVGKGAVNIIKSAGKGLKNIGKGIGKAFKRITSSTIGKVLVGSAAIYLGGWALGYWNGPMSLFSGGGAAAGSGSVASTTSVATPTVGAGVGSGAGVGVGSAAGTTAGTVGSTAATEGVVSQVAGNALRDWASVAATEGSKQAASSGIISSFLKNPTVQSSIAGGVSAVGGALLAPTPEDEAKAAEESRRRQMQLAYGGVGNIKIPQANAGQPIRDQFGNLVYDSSGRLNNSRIGLINSRLGLQS